MLRPMIGDRISLVGVVTATSIAVGLVEAGVLTLLANIAATMVLHGHGATIVLAPFDMHLSVGRAILLALALTVVRLVLRVVVAWLPVLIAANVQAKLREELFDAFTRCFLGDPGLRPRRSLPGTDDQPDPASQQRRLVRF